MYVPLPDVPHPGVVGVKDTEGHRGHGDHDLTVLQPVVTILLTQVPSGVVCECTVTTFPTVVRGDLEVVSGEWVSQIK